MELLLLALVVLAIPVLGIAAFFLVLGARTRLQTLEERILLLEGRLKETLTPSAPSVPPPISDTAAAPSAETAASAIPEEVVEERAGGPMPGAIPAAGSPATPGRTSTDLEEKFGTRWVVYIGGLALALGGVFLVRYSIEQGLLGPGMRIFLGGLFAAGLVTAGEWQRRQERSIGLAGISPAHIPSILTAAGTTVAYATVFAAYALYDFFGPALAFILLGLVALATLAAALLHGPALAGLGLVGAYVAPLLVRTEEPSYWALYLYLAFVTAAAFALARMRMWRWLAVTAMIFAAVWILPGSAEPSFLLPHAFHAVSGFSLAAIFLVSGFLFGPSAMPGRVEHMSSAALAIFLLAAAWLVLESRHDAFAMCVVAALVTATVAIAFRAEAAVAAVPGAALLVILVMVLWAVPVIADSLIAPAEPVAGLVPEPTRAATGFHLLLGAALAALFGISGFLAQGRTQSPLAAMLWAASAVAAPLAILAALYFRIAGFERSIPFAAMALLLATLFAYATELLTRRPHHFGQAAAGAIFATGGIAALALALTLATEKGWLTVGLALMAPGIAWVEQKRPLPALRWAVAAAIVLVLARLWWDPRIVGSEVGATPIFNWLLYGYGVPAASFWMAGYLLRRRADDIPARMADSAAVLFTVLTAFLQIRHYMSGGDIYRATGSLTEIALQVCVGLALAIGLERVRGRTGSIVHNVGAMVIAGLTLLAIVFGLLLGMNPILHAWRTTAVEGVVFNVLLLGYGLPAVLAAVLAWITRTTRPQWYRAVAAVTAVALAMVYLTLEVARLYQGPLLRLANAGDAERYTYSAVWLVFAVALLMAGIIWRSQPVRYCSAAVMLLTIAKVFLFDMAGVTGFFRALSFICLGLVLVGIGWLYQRLLFRSPGTAPPAPQPASL